MKKVIITGACGFLGGKLAEVLVNRGIAVYALDCADNDFFHQYKSIKYYKCNLEKEILLFDDDIMNCDALFHFAWNGVNNKNDYECQLKNITVLMNVLTFARHSNVLKTIIPGSASEYAASEMPITGNNAPGTIDSYGAAKSACHIIARTWSIQNNLSLIWLVPSSIYGPGRNDNNVLTYAIKTLLKNEKPSFTALEQRWDYIYIDDIITAFILIAEKGLSGKNYAVGSGTARELREYITITRDCINPALPLGIGEIPYKSKKTDNSVMDIKELQNDTGFMPSVTFEEGIKRTIEWFKHFG